MVRTWLARRMVRVVGSAIALGLAACILAAGCGAASDQGIGLTPDGMEGYCALGSELCSGVCVSISSDNANCGVCGNVCAAGQACSGGICSCSSGLANCLGACVNTATDTVNCGACGNACAQGQVCAAGRCQCQTGLTACTNGCVDTASDGDNCGGCGSVCAEGTVCSQGVCSASCGAGLTQCDRSCVDIQTNVLNCGQCGTACPSGQTCTFGTCSCGEGTVACGGRCVDASTDPSNCGACGVTCSGGQTCSGGACTCPSGQQTCGNVCTDTTSDPAHCGNCETICGQGQTCTDGQCGCTAPGSQLCGGACVNTEADKNHCGACGNRCGANESCSGGVCVTASAGTGGRPNTGGAPSAGGQSTGGFNSGGGGTSTGGTSDTGGVTSTGGSTEPCEDKQPPNDSTPCATWATYQGMCASDWFISNDYCAKSCNRCGGGGGSSSGGTISGGAQNTGGTNPTGGAQNTGGSAGSGETLPPLNGGTDGWASRYWDCCKPHCAWQGNVSGGTPAPTCSQDNTRMSGYDAKNACEAGGTGFMCWDFAPWSVSSALSYGFAAFNGTQCGKCYQIQFSGSSHNAGADPGSSSLSGKQMVVQVINIGGIEQNQFDLLIPGGGVGAMNACSTQWGSSDLGAQYGGFLANCTSGDRASCVRQKCQSVFANKPDLLAGCNWFVEWFGAADNPSLKYKEIACPQALKSKSGLNG